MKLRNLVWTFRHIYDHAFRFARRLPGYAFRYGLSHTLAFTFARLWFTATKRVIPVCFPGGYMITTPQQLINHQSIFVERELWHQRLASARIGSILDVGANMGQSALFFRLEFPLARMALVDPLFSYENLRGFVSRITGQPEIYARAIATYNGDTTLHVCRDVGGLTASTMQYADRGESINVKCCKLLVEGIPFDLIKIDVDGAEMTVLRALTDNQWTNCRAFVIECVPDKLDEIDSLIKQHRPDMQRFRTGHIDFAWITSN